jgi:hypothetical protein
MPPTSLYFGEPWRSMGGAQRVDPPIGEACLTCGEPIAEGDQGYVRVVLRTVDILTAHEVAPVHAECEALGIVGHTFGVCTCTGYDTRSRAAARILWERILDANLAVGEGG